MPEDGPRWSTRRKFLGVRGAAFAAAAMGSQQVRSDDHSQSNKEQPGENNIALDAENPNSVWSPETDNGTVEHGHRGFCVLRGLPHRTYKDMSAAEWLAHAPARFVDQHIKTGEDFVQEVQRKEKL